MRNIIIFCICVLLFASVQSQAAEPRKVVNGIDANNAPFSYLDKDSKPAGFDVEVVDWIARDLGMTVEHVPMVWDGIISNLVSGKIDIIAAGMTINEERRKKVGFTQPYWVNKPVMVIRKDSRLTVKDLFTRDKKLGIQKGTAAAQWLQEEKKKKGNNMTLRLYTPPPLQGYSAALNQYDALPPWVRDLVNGRLDAAVMDEAPAQHAASTMPVKILGPFGMPDEEFGYAVRLGDSMLLSQINASLRKLMASPDWQQLVKKYNM